MSAALRSGADGLWFVFACDPAQIKTCTKRCTKAFI